MQAFLHHLTEIQTKIGVALAEDDVDDLVQHQSRLLDCETGCATTEVPIDVPASPAPFARRSSIASAKVADDVDRHLRMIIPVIACLVIISVLAIILFA